MKVIGSLVAVVVVAGAALSSSPGQAEDRTATQLKRAAGPIPTEWSAQRRKRARGTPIYVYGRSGYLPPTAKRACNAWYEQEFRPSGTVIVPRMRCYWVNG